MHREPHPEVPRDSSQFRVRILLYDRDDRYRSPATEFLIQLRKSGISVEFSHHSMQELGMNRERVAQYVSETPSDAWIVCAGSHEILEWFAEQPFPTLAVYGRFYGLPIAAVGPRQSTATTECVDRLVELGHRRMIMLTRKERRQPKPALYEQNFLDRLAYHGLPAGNNVLPEWEESLKGLRKCLDSLFTSPSPPTALLLQEAPLLMATLQFLANRGITTPGQVSLFCIDHDPDIDWCDPPIAHSQWNNKEVVRLIEQWVQNIIEGKTDTKQSLVDTIFIKGGTIASPPARVENKMDKLW